MADEKRFVLIQDDDGHWFVCPVDKQEEASAYFEACYADENPEQPEWLDSVGGAPSLVEFTGYAIR